MTETIVRALLRIFFETSFLASYFNALIIQIAQLQVV